jgi:hypothetical protein
MPQFDHLVSRGATCWRPDDWDPDEEWPPILKSSWQYVTRAEEGQRLAALYERGVPAVVAYGKGRVTVDSATTKYTTDFARGGCAMGPEHDFGSRWRHRLGAKRSLAGLSDDGPLRSSYSSFEA